MKYICFIYVSFLIFLGCNPDSLITQKKANPEVFTEVTASTDQKIVLPKGERFVNMWGDGDVTNMLTIDSASVYHWRRKITHFDSKGFTDEKVIMEHWQANNTYGQNTIINADTSHTTYRP